MGKNNHYFLFGGIYAFSIFAAILLSVYFILQSTHKPTYFSVSDDLTLSVSMQELNDKATQKYIEDMTNTVADKGSSELDQKEDIDSLFENIKTESIVYSKESDEDEKAKVDEEFLKKIQLRTKVVHKDEASKEIKRLTIKEAELSSENTPLKEAKRGEKNEYYAKVHDILYAQWHPAASSERAIVKVKISPSGNFDYNVKQWSGNEQFNKELESHLEYLKEQKFPPPPSGGSITLDVNFISKDKSE